MSSLMQVKASAGSGKTYTLTSAFLEHLKGVHDDGTPRACGPLPPGAGCRLPEIMAVTFTNKAAAEMKERVIGALKERALGQAGGPAGQWSEAEAAQRLAELLRAFGSLNIRTIDSFLSMFVRLSALDLHIPPDFEPVFEPSELVRPLYDALVADADAGDAAAQTLLDHALETLLRSGKIKGFLLKDSFHADLLKAFAFRLTDDTPLVHDPAPIANRLVALHTAMQDASASLLATLRAENVSPTKPNMAALTEGCDFKPFETADKFKKPRAIGAKTHIDDILPKATKGTASTAAQDAFTAFISAYNALFAERKNLLNYYRFAALGALAERLARDLDEYQLRTGMVPQLRWAAYALRALENGSASEAFCRLGTRLTHLLVDEFQDTSREQWLAMAPLASECLSKGGTLFYVGDVKQAIYGWRGGDARLFDEVATNPEIAGPAGGAALNTLERNWRSSPAVVEFNNTLFSRLADPATAAAVASAMLPNDAANAERDALAASLASAYADTEQLLHPDADPDENPGFVRITDLGPGKHIPAEEAVHDALESLFTEELLPRRQYSDIAVLVRTNGQAAQIAQWLVEWQVPVITEGSLLLAEHPLVRQAVALLDFLDYPPDEIALWNVIGGDELFLGAWRRFFPQDAERATRSAMAAWLARTTDDGPLAQRFQRDFPESWEALIRPFLRRAGLMSPYDMVSEFFGRFLVFERRPEDTLFARRFLEAVHASESAGCLSLSTFLEWWRQNGEKEKVPLPEHMDAVRIMTFHKAKGLEFPVVVTPWTNLSTRPHEGLTTVQTEFGRCLTRQTRELGDIYVRQAVQEATEMMNQLYVAWTRPTEELYAFTGLGEQLGRGLALLLAQEPFELSEETQTFVYESGTQRDAKGRMAEAEQEAQTPPPPPEQDEPEPPADTGTGWTPMGWLPRLKIRRNELERETFDERKRGELVHGCLEGLRLTGDNAVDAERAVQFALGNAPVEDRERMARELRTILDWLLGLPEFSLWHTRGMPERSILDESGSVFRADLLVEEDERTLVVEYKTGRERDEHVQQVRGYMRLLTAMPSRRSKPVAGVLVYLDQQRLVPVTPAGGAS